MDLRKAAAVLTVAMIAMPAWADGNGKGKQGHGQAQVLEHLQLQTSQLTLTGYITAGERQTILSYFQQHQAAYAGVKPLPPGIAKKVARGGAMPPGIAKRYFPPELLGQLPARPGQQWIIAGTDVVLVNTATNMIVDLLQKVF